MEEMTKLKVKEEELLSCNGCKKQRRLLETQIESAFRGG